MSLFLSISFSISFSLCLSVSLSLYLCLCLCLPVSLSPRNWDTGIPVLVRGVYQSSYTNTSAGTCGCEDGTNFCDYLEDGNTTGFCVSCDEVETAGDCWLRFNSRDMGDRRYTRSLHAASVGQDVDSWGAKDCVDRCFSSRYQANPRGQVDVLTDGEIISYPSPHEDIDREGGGGGADATASLPSMDETTHPEDNGDADCGAVGDTMDSTNSAEPSRGQVQDGASAGGQQLVTVAPSWVSDIREQARVRGETTAAAEAYVARLAKSTANIVRIYDRWRAHCESLEVDPVRASDDAILAAVDAYAHALSEEEEITISVYNARMRVVSNVY